MRLNVFAIQSPTCGSSKCDRGGVAPIVFDPGTPWRGAPVLFLLDSVGTAGRAGSRLCQRSVLSGAVGGEREPQVPVRLRSGPALDFAPNDTGRGEPRFSAAPTVLGSSSRLIPQPSGLGSRLAVGPPGLASTAILQCHFSLNLPQASRLLGMTKGRVALTSAAVTEG